MADATHSGSMPPDERPPDEGGSHALYDSPAGATERLGSGTWRDDDEVRRLLHQIREYQLLLEDQNEHLRQTQAELEAARERYRNLFAQAPVGLFTVGVRARILDCNHRGAELLRLSIAAVMRRRLTEFMTPEDATVFTENVSLLYKTREPITLEFELRRSDGKYFWAELIMNVTREPNSDAYLCRVTITDQSDRKRMQDEAGRLVAIVASSEHAIFSHNLEGIIQTWNAGAERLFGYTAKEALGKPFEMLLPPDRAEEAEEISDKVRRNRSVAEESVRRRSDGSLVPVFFSAAPIIAPHGAVMGVSHIVRDITEQVGDRNELARVLESLRVADRRKDDFIATLAHELRNPLAPIRNAAAVLRFMPDLNPRLQWCRDVIDRQVGHMAALLEDLLDVSRLTRDKITLRRDRIEIGSAIAQAVEINRPMIESRSQRLAVESTPHPILVEGDLTRLTQIFGNLLNNSAKYTEPGGEIHVVTELRDTDVVVRVRDNGIGIRPEYLTTIFDLFAQVEVTREGAEGGLGIGLALVKGLVERHGGTISAHSEGLGKGSEFIVTLPVVTEAPRAPSGEQAIVTASRNGTHSFRVLIVDDNVDAADSLAMIITNIGHDVRVAHDGERALEIAEEFRPHLAVLDIGMPRMSGYEVAHRMRQESWGRNMMLIACTGWGQPSDRRRSEEAGFDHHLVKPASPGAIVRLLAKIEETEAV